MLNKLIRILLAVQGKGYGSTTIKNEVRAIKKFVRGGVLFDVGANKGKYTQELLAQYEKSISEIHVFEPSKELVAEYLIDNDPRVRVNNFALSSYSGTASLYKVPGYTGLNSLTKRRLDHFNMEMGEVEEIETITLDDYVANNNISRIDLLKMDVEGHELDVLNGAINSLKNNIIGCIQFEFGGANIDTRYFFQDFWYFLVKKYGFEIYRITPFGVNRLVGYSESDEIFLTTNYVAIKR